MSFSSWLAVCLYLFFVWDKQTFIISFYKNVKLNFILKKCTYKGKKRVFMDKT